MSREEDTLFIKMPFPGVIGIFLSIESNRIEKFPRVQRLRANFLLILGYPDFNFL